MRGSKCQVEGTTRLFCEEQWTKKVSHWEIRKRASWHVHGLVHVLTSLGRCYLPAQFLLHLISWVQNVQSPGQVHILPMIVSSTFYIWHIPYVCPLIWTLVGYLQIAFVFLTWLGRLTNMFLASSILISMILTLDHWDHFLLMEGSSRAVGASDEETSSNSCSNFEKITPAAACWWEQDEQRKIC